MNYTIIGTILLGIFILAAITIFFSNGGFGGAKSSQKPTFLITGPVYSGKTTLFTKWVKGSVSDTVSSSTPNVCEDLQVPFGTDKVENSYTLVDLPGNPKLQYLTAQYIAKCRDNLQGIIFMVDAAAGQKAIVSAAHDLFRLLTLTEKRAGGVNILIAANKSDVFNVLSSSRIYSILEKEINDLRDSKSKGVGEVSVNDDGDDGSWIGLDGEFKFEHLEGELRVIEGSVTAGRTQKWENWVDIHSLNN